MGIKSANHKEKTRQTAKISMLAKIAKIISFSVATFGLSVSNECKMCIDTKGFGDCFAICNGFSPMFMTSTQKIFEKRGGNLRALCLKNPRAVPCLRALGDSQNSNLMW